MFVVIEGILAVIAALILCPVLAVLFIKTMKENGAAAIRVLFTSLICIAVVVGILGSKRMIEASRVVGVYSGTEYDTIEINGVKYEADYNAPYNSPDKEKLLGKAVCAYDIIQGNTYDPMYIWTVKGSDDYIYALLVYDGVFYKKAE